jgi:hypothetical protein
LGHGLPASGCIPFSTFHSFSECVRRLGYGYGDEQNGMGSVPLHIQDRNRNPKVWIKIEMANLAKAEPSKCFVAFLGIAYLQTIGLCQ